MSSFSPVISCRYNCLVSFTCTHRQRCARIFNFNCYALTFSCIILPAGRMSFALVHVSNRSELKQRSCENERCVHLVECINGGAYALNRALCCRIRKHNVALPVIPLVHAVIFHILGLCLGWTGQWIYCVTIL